MTDDMYTLFENSRAVLSGHFVLSSGKHSNMYLQCARLLQNPQKAQYVASKLIELCSDMKIDTVISPALGGIIIGYELARQMNTPFIFTERKEGTMQLRRMFSIVPDAHYLVVEDVITTGESTLEVARLVQDHGGQVSGFASLVDRSNGNHLLPQEPRSLIKIETRLFSPASCPMCKKNQPLNKPGSKQK